MSAVSDNVTLRHFESSISTRADDAISCLLRSKTTACAQHHQGVLFGLQWACDAFASSTGFITSEKLQARCRVSSGYINDAYTAALAEIKGSSK